MVHAKSYRCLIQLQLRVLNEDWVINFCSFLRYCNKWINKVEKGREGRWKEGRKVEGGNEGERKDREKVN